MSLPHFDGQGSLFGSLGSLAPELFDAKDCYEIFARKIWPVLVSCRRELEECYENDNGRPGVEPVVLLGVMLLQFMERLPDRQAARELKYNLGWKHALNLEIGERGFHHTTLFYFRQRLALHAKSDLVMRMMTQALGKEGLIAKESKQRLDSTHILAAVARLSRLECVRETLRLALRELEPSLETRPSFWAEYWERYVESKLDYKSSEEQLKSKFTQCGLEIYRLIEWVKENQSQAQYGQQMELLAEVFNQQYQIIKAEIEPIKINETGVVQNPHDADAQWSAKGQAKEKKEWVGYKVQIAETVVQKQSESKEKEPQFITSVVTQKASESDEAGLEESLEQQEQIGQDKPKELYVDGAYVSGEKLTQAQEQGWELMGPAQPSANRWGISDQYRIEAFDIDIKERQAQCPGGYQSTQCSRIKEARKKHAQYRYEWSYHCHQCPLRQECVPDGQRHRTIIVSEYHEALQKRRREQQSPEFKEQMHQRNGIESTISELVRAHGMRRSRYRGFIKVQLQNFTIAAACNAKRWIQQIQKHLIKQQNRNGDTQRVQSMLKSLVNVLQWVFCIAYQLLIAKPFSYII
jgi:hypothetical protein